jgi:predicted HTH transcriptional regulator
MPVPVHPEAYLMGLIARGEHVQQDFKLRIDDARKIARTLCAFANTRGGRLLVGVKDNGRIAGVDAEEEVHMVQAGAEVYAVPPIPFEVRVHASGGKQVLEAWVPPSNKRPHMVVEADGTRLAYFREADENHPAPVVLMRSWKLPEAEQQEPSLLPDALLEVFKILGDQSLTLNQMQRLGTLPRGKLVHGLAQLLRWGLLGFRLEQGKAYYFSQR